MNGLFVDQNIGEMFHDIVNDVAKELPEKVDSIGEKIEDIANTTITINLPLKEDIWLLVVPIIAIILVIILSIIIHSLSKKERIKKLARESSERESLNSYSGDIEKLFEESAFGKENGQAIDFAKENNIRKELPKDSLSEIIGKDLIVEAPAEKSPAGVKSFAEAEAPAEKTFPQANVAAGIGTPAEKAPAARSFVEKEQPEKLQPEKANQEMISEPIKMEKIKVIASIPSKKFGPDNFNVGRSGKIYTEEELNELIRK